MTNRQRKVDFLSKGANQFVTFTEKSQTIIYQTSSLASLKKTIHHSFVPVIATV